VRPRPLVVAGQIALAALGTVALWRAGLVPALLAIGPSGTPTPVEAPVVLNGSGGHPGPPFRLRGGTYALDWSAAAPSPDGDDCVLAVEGLWDTKFYQLLFDAHLDVGLRAEGQTRLRRLPVGRYAVRVGGTCDCTVTIRANERELVR
jgi:hypothetical protein